MNNKESKTSWYIKCLAAFILTYGVFFAKYPHYVLHPNNQTFVSNGDLLITLSDMIYHVKYDTDGTFSGMNYPTGEYIFMTDANGSFATLFRWIDSYMFDIDTILPGILMTLIFLLIGMCGMFLFMILRTSGISTKLAFLLAPLITLLSPQMVRIACHLSLSFPFVLPMIMLWTLRKYRVPKLEIWDLIFATVTFFFFMNNAYVGFIMCMFAGLIGFVVLVSGYKTGNNRKAAIIMMTVPVVITLIVYVLLKINDPYDDRLEEQWGFFYYHTKPYSLFYPKYSLAASFFAKYRAGDFRSIEWTNNLGLIPMGLVLSYWIYSITRIFKKSLPRLFPKDIMMTAFLWASFLMFLFASNTALFPIKEVIESYMGPLLMFKSSGRFSWPLYFVVALFAAKILQGWVSQIEFKKQYLSLALLVPLIGIYVYETNFYLDSRFTGKDRQNYLTAPQTDDLVKVLDKAEVNTDNYQAMFVLPLFLGWNEKMRAGVYNRSERGALSVTTLTGIPMINARLSRNSTSKTMAVAQVSSNPLIHKEVFDLMPNDKPILLIQGTNIQDRLSEGELALREIATEVFRVKKFIGYKLEVADIEKYRQQVLAEATQYFESNKDQHVEALIQNHYDDQPVEGALFGQGAYTIHEGKEQLVNFTREFVKGDSLRFTAWTEITNKKYGMPEFFIYVKGPDKHYYQKKVFTRENKNIYKNWIRSEHTFPVPGGKSKIEVVVKCNQDVLVDQMEISFKNDTMIYDLGAQGFLFNNFPAFE